MTVASPPIEQDFVLDNVDWEFYEMLLAQLEEHHIFVTYDRGRIELMSPSFRHDKRGRHIGLLIAVLAEELGIGMQGGGSTTFKRRDLDKGLEADECFYIKNVDRVLEKDEIDLSTDPPPDLAVEVEVSRRIIPRLPIYAKLGVPEIWRDDGERVHVLTLDSNGEYREVERGLSFPMISSNEISRLVGLAKTMNETQWLRAIREWVKQNLVR